MLGGIFYLKLDTFELVKHILLLTPCRLQACTILFQSWLLAFNPCQPTGLAILCWIFLKNLPLEFYQSATKTIADAVGTILEEDHSMQTSRDPRFCMVVNPVGGYVSKFKVANLNRQFSEITIEYEVEDTTCQCCNIAPYTKSNYLD